MKIIFVNLCSPFLITDKGAPPLGLLYLAAGLRACNHNVTVWDMTGNIGLTDLFGISHSIFIADSEFLKKARAALPDEPEALWALSSTSAQYDAALNLSHAIRSRWPRATVIIGGSHVSALPNGAWCDGFDAVFAGEADDALPEWIAQGCPPPGIIYAKAPRNLDRLPLPARDLVDLPSYCSNMTIGEGLSTTIHMSRGCPFACKYCVRTLGDAARLLRVRSIEQIGAEVDALRHEYGITRFVATDDVFGIKEPWLAEFCGYFFRSGYHFRVNMRANTLHFDLLPQMKRAGIDVISFGFESGSEDVLRAISKNNVALNTKAVRACHEAGIDVKAYLIFGFAEDGPASVEATKRWIEEARPDSVQVATLVPLPGTPIYQDAINRGWAPDYSKLYHNGKNGKAGDMILPWWNEHTLELRDDLISWIESFYGKLQGSIECPLALSNNE